MLACEIDSLSQVEDLLKNGANPNCCNEVSVSDISVYYNRSDLLDLHIITM